MTTTDKVERPPLGHIVAYVSQTPHWDVIIPAEVIGYEDNGLTVRLRLYIDKTGGSEWVTSAEYDYAKGHATWHYADEIGRQV